MPVGTFRLCLYTELGLEMLGNVQGVPISSVFISIGLLQNNKGQICQISVGSKGQNIMGQRCQINVSSKGQNIIGQRCLISVGSICKIDMGSKGQNIMG